MRRCVVRSHCCVTYGTLMMCVFTNKIVTFSPTVPFPELIFFPKKDSHNCASIDINLEGTLYPMLLFRCLVN